MNKQTGKWSGCLVFVFMMVMTVELQTYALADDKAASQQCFTDAKQAYAYLIRQQNLPKVNEVMLIDINTATEGELTTLDGIGSSKAQAIILYREVFGRFAHIDELTNVKGIGQKTVDNNRSRLRVD